MMRNAIRRSMESSLATGENIGLNKIGVKMPQTKAQNIFINLIEYPL